MALPLLLLGGLATAGSTIANMFASKKAENARNDALAAERIRQNALDREAMAVNARSQDRYEDFEGQQGKRKEKLGDYFANADTSAPPDPGTANAIAATAAPAASGNSIVTNETNKQLARAKDFTGQQATALAGLRSFGDLLGEQSRLTGRDAGLVGQIGGFKRGSSNVLPLELEEASQKGAGLKLLGDILGGLGGIGINAGLTGGGTLAGIFGGGKAAATAASVAPAVAAAPAARAVAPVLAPQSRFLGVY